MPLYNILHFPDYRDLEFPNICNGGKFLDLEVFLASKVIFTEQSEPQGASESSREADYGVHCSYTWKHSFPLLLLTYPDTPFPWPQMYTIVALINSLHI